MWVKAAQFSGRTPVDTPKVKQDKGEYSHRKKQRICRTVSTQWHPRRKQQSLMGTQSHSTSASAFRAIWSKLSRAKLLPFHCGTSDCALIHFQFELKQHFIHLLLLRYPFSPFLVKKKKSLTTTLFQGISGLFTGFLGSLGSLKRF